MPSISIIVPVFNGIRYLPYFLQSLAEATPNHAEIIFVDDDSSEPVFEAVPDEISGASVVKLRNDHNRGYSAVINRGVSCANGDIIIQLNTDLILERRCIDAIVELIERKPKAGMVGSKQILPTTGLVRHIGMAFGTYRHRHIYSGMPADHPLCNKTRQMQLVSGAIIATTRQVLNDVGPLDERYYNTLENFDHCLKAHKCGYVNYTSAQSVVYHWVGQSGPARFAREKEGEALFWANWTSLRSIDLDRFVDESLDHLLATQPHLLRYKFEPLSLCRDSDESILLECLEKRWVGITSTRSRTRILNSPHTKIWLQMELPHRAMMNPSPYIYLVDRISNLSENRLWFEIRHRIVESEIVLDTRAVAMTTREMVALYGKDLL